MPATNGAITMPHPAAKRLLSQFQQIDQNDPEFFEKSRELVLLCLKQSGDAGNSYDFAGA